MGEITVPRYIFSLMFHPKGWRTAPMPLPVWPAREGERKPVTMFPIVVGKDFNPFAAKDVFEHWEYRFWCGSMFQGRVASECRCCGAEGGDNTKARHEHQKMGGCTKKLIKAYSLLLKDNVCVICDTKTHREKWGVPLCSASCQQAWCEAEPQPKALMFALLIVQKEMGDA